MLQHAGTSMSACMSNTDLILSLSSFFIRVEVLQTCMALLKMNQVGSGALGRTGKVGVHAAEAGVPAGPGLRELPQAGPGVEVVPQDIAVF